MIFQSNPVAYGLSQALIGVFPAPVVAQRDPSTRDTAQIGTIWINNATNDFFILTSIASGLAQWSAPANGTGIFTSLEATTADITADQGNIVATLGNVTAGAAMSAATTITAGTGITATTGNIAASAGAVSASTTVTAGTGITATTGNITASTGNLVSTLGSVSAATTVTAGTGLHATTGGVTAASGNIVATLGDITASAGNIHATLGSVSGVSVGATGDAAVTGALTLTHTVNTTQSTGALSIVSTTANPGNNAGFLKMYDAASSTIIYVPYFTDIAP